MKKLELLSQIEGLSTVLASEKARGYMSDASVAEMQKALDMMTDEYLTNYCAA